MIGRDDRVEGAAHRAHEDGVGGKGTGDPRLPRCRREQQIVLATEAATVAGVRIERAERDARLGDAEPLAQSLARDTSRNGLCVVASTTRRGLGIPGLGRVAASIIATDRPVRAASSSVCPGKW